MSEDSKEQRFEPLSNKQQSDNVPNGYRSGVITAITVVLGFSLLFVRSWMFELPGEWTVDSILASILLLVSILIQLVALWRALQIRDSQLNEYEKTLRWFVAAVTVLLISLILAAIAYSTPFRL